MVMTGKYPQANQTAQARPQFAGGGTFDHVEKLCLHTTETSDWPGYPKFAPHLTYNPWTHIWHQHFPLTKSATTLADPSSTRLRENRDYVIQVEIVGYCDPKYNTPSKGIDYIDDRAVRDLAEFAAWLHKTAGLELRLAPTWLRYPSSYGKSKARMSESEFDAFRGICGHEHASGNDHGDPGDPPWLDKFLRYAIEATGQTAPATTTGGPKFMKDVYTVIQTSKPQVLKAGENSVALNDKGDLTLVIGPNSGVDLLATLVIKDPAGQRVTPESGVESAFRVVSYKDKTPTTTVSTRRTTLTDQVSFKGDISKLPDGRSPRLRLIVKVPAAGYTIESGQITGWVM